MTQNPEPNVDAVLAEVQLEQAAGRIEAAENLLAAAHAAAPNAVEFPAYLGQIRLAQGKLQGAAEAFRTALTLAPEASMLFLGLATTLDADGDLDGAETAYRKALEFDPDNAAAFNNFGLTLRRNGKAGAAIDMLRQAVKLSPEKASFQANLARVLHDDGQYPAAKTAAERAVHLDPESVDALVNLGCILRELGIPGAAVQALVKAAEIAPEVEEVWLNLGLAYRDDGDLDKAIQTFKTLLSYSPELGPAHANLGRMLHLACQYSEAETAYLRALELNPDDPQTLVNFASLLIDFDRIDAAETACRRALEINPRSATALANLACILSERGDFAQSISLNAQAIALAPDDIQIRRNVADPLFLDQQFDKAWQAYEFRWEKSDRPRRPFPQPAWTGEDLSGKTLLVWAEQGIGDTMLFSTCLGDAMNRAERVIFEVDHRLLPLYRRTFPALEVVARNEPSAARLLEPDINLQCPVGSLPRYFRPDLQSFPPVKKFFEADPQRLTYWRERLQNTGTQSIKAGFFWRSGATNREFIRAYSTLDEWLPVLGRADVDFISFQYGQSSDELRRFGEANNLNLHFFDDIDLFEDLDDIAALSAACDVFVGPVTTNCWLSAAVGVPTLVAGLAGEWLPLGTNTLPWLPSIEYFRRAPEGPWRRTIEDIAERIGDTVSGAQSV